MTFGSDNLTPLLVPPPAQELHFSQGRILAWNPGTFENQIAWRGVTLTNVPVMSGAEAITYQPGDVVGLVGWNPGGGTGSWWILGRIVIPGAGAAEQAIEWMTDSLARAISAEVFADRIHVDTADPDPPADHFFAGPYSDSGNPQEPEVTNVDITDTGKALVIISAHLQAANNVQTSMNVSVEVSGATFVSPSDDNSIEVTAPGDAYAFRLNTVIPLNGLNPGLHDFIVRYKTPSGSIGGFVHNITLVVIAF